MKKQVIGIFGICACLGSPLCADRFSEFDQGLIAGKGIFPDDGSEGEAMLPEGEAETPAPSTDKKPGTKTQTPQKKQPTPLGGKGAPFPDDDDQ